MASNNWKDHKARRQVQESDLPKGIPPQNGTVFNQWYNKWSHGDSSSSSNTRFVSPFRLDPERDSGATASTSDCHTFCLYFARGCCILGSKCQYLHHIPQEDEDTLRKRAHDCFGREKHSHYRDDMGGVGSFQNENRTLYIGGISNALNGGSRLKPVQIENRLKFLFRPLGTLEKIRYLENKNCAFVTYKHAINAEFAKEVMSNQTLLIPSDKEWDRRMDGAGLLVKWGKEDPDPRAKRQRLQEQHESSLKLMESLLQRHQDNHEKKSVPKKDNLPQEPALKRQKLTPLSQKQPYMETSPLVTGYDSSSSESD